MATIASLYLPSLNADIIDKGVATGDTGYILRTGGWMLAGHARADRLLDRAPSTSARGRRWASAATCAAASSTGSATFSAREVARFGAPSLITRNTNDVQQVQMLVLMTCTMLVAAPIMCVGGIIMALREDLGLSWLMLVGVPALLVVDRRRSSSGWCRSSG